MKCSRGHTPHLEKATHTATKEKPVYPNEDQHSQVSKLQEQAYIGTKYHTELCDLREKQDYEHVQAHSRLDKMGQVFQPPRDNL